MFSYAGLYHGVLGILSLAGTIISLIVLYRGHSVGKSPLGVSLTNLAVNQLGFALFGPATFIMPSYFAQHWVWGSAGCNMFGFLKSYFQIVILSSVLILTIERYLNRWNIDKCYTPQFFYKLSIGLWLYDALWASFPLFGWGRYEKKDFSCDLVMTPMSYGQWKDFSYTISFLFASFVLPSAIMFHLLGKTRNRKTMIVWKVNSKHTWLDSPQILRLTVIMITFVFTLFCCINLFGFLDWLPVSLTGDRQFYFETLHSILTHAMVLINPLWYLIGVSSVRQELGKNYVESAVRVSSTRHFVVKPKSAKRKGPASPKPAESGTRKTNKSESMLSRGDSQNRCALLQVKNDK